MSNEGLIGELSNAVNIRLYFHTQVLHIPTHKKQRKKKQTKQNKTTHNYRRTKIKYQPQKPKKGVTFTHKTGPGLTGPSQSPAPKQHSLSVQLRKDAAEDMLLPSPPPSTA